MYDTPFVNMSVHDFCFDYQDDVIQSLNSLVNLGSRLALPEKFGLFSKVNTILKFYTLLSQFSIKRLV